MKISQGVLKFVLALLTMCVLIFGSIAVILLRPNIFGMSLLEFYGAGRFLRLLAAFDLSVACVVVLCRLYWPVQRSIWKEQGGLPSRRPPAELEYVFCGAAGTLAVLGVLREGSRFLSALYLALAFYVTKKATYLYLTKCEMERSSTDPPPEQK